MRNADQWQPTKFVQTDQGLRGTHDTSHLRASSRLQADAVGELLGAAITTHARGRLADLGCGQVPFYETYRDHVDEVVCVDWIDNPYLDVVADLSEPLPFPDDHVDTVLLADVIEHVPRTEALLRESARILRPGGTVLISVPFLYLIHEPPHDYFRPTEFALRWLAEEVGLEVVSLEPTGGSIEVLGDFVGKHLAQAPKVGDGAAVGLQSAVRWFTRSTQVGRRVSTVSAERFPSGYVVVLRQP